MLKLGLNARLYEHQIAQNARQGATARRRHAVLRRDDVMQHAKVADSVQFPEEEPGVPLEYRGEHDVLDYSVLVGFVEMLVEDGEVVVSSEVFDVFFLFYYWIMRVTVISDGKSSRFVTFIWNVTKMKLVF